MAERQPKTEGPSSLTESRLNERIGPVIIILIGVFIFAVQYFNLGSVGLSVPLILGVIFIVWGYAARNSGLFVPGGILGGVGLGLLMLTMENELVSELSKVGLFFLSMGVGWAIIPIFSWSIGRREHVWAYIPAGILGAMGILFLLGSAGLEVLEFIGTYWPLALVAVGVYFLIRQRRA
ncbi:MAG: hypothetical protein PHG63_00665 [Candidatus Dojkabacteria bacterium]|nr:hypothetical protein [Candidatus Dojkabacteria bacterium]